MCIAAILFEKPEKRHIDGNGSVASFIAKENEANLIFTSRSFSQTY